jgi:hypothetical protein
LSGTLTEIREALVRWVVDRLYDDLPVRRQLPRDDPEWSDAFIWAIRAHKEQFRGSRDLRRLLAIAGDLLYGKSIHWALELLQNAEDAGTTCLSFVFEPDRIVVWNNGHTFTEEDVWGICSAGHSAKRNKIGFFGIGFESVYKLTAAPEVFSGTYACWPPERSRAPRSAGMSSCARAVAGVLAVEAPTQLAGEIDGIGNR